MNRTPLTSEEWHALEQNLFSAEQHLYVFRWAVARYGAPANYTGIVDTISKLQQIKAHADEAINTLKHQRENMQRDLDEKVDQ